MPAEARGISLDVGQQNVTLSYSFHVGADPDKATEINFGAWSDAQGNRIYFARSAVYGNVSGTAEGWRIGGGGQANYITLNNEMELRSGYSNPGPHALDLFLGFSYTISGRVPIIFGFDTNYSFEVLSFGRLENKVSYNSYVNFELLPSFVMRLGYAGHRLYFKNGNEVNLNNRLFLGIDILF